MFENSPCLDCIAHEECGGWSSSNAENEMFDCFEVFPSANGHFTHTSFPMEMARRLGEVSFHRQVHSRKFVQIKPGELPSYLPLVQGGLTFHRPLKLEFAALNLIDIFHGCKERRLKFGERKLTADSLRKEWGLHPSTRVLLSGVANDPSLERLWANYRIQDLGKNLAGLNIFAITAPNFTFWKNAPRIENLINRRRMFKIAEAFSNEGVSVIPHLNSTHPNDWKWMTEFFKEHSELNSVCMEFRTGNRFKEIRREKINSLATLREQIGRNLYPIIIGNIEAAREVFQYFGHVTAIDSTPSIKTIKRQKPVPGANITERWSKKPIASGQCLSALFEQNYRSHRRRVINRIYLSEREVEVDKVMNVGQNTPSPTSNCYVQDVLPLDAA